MDTNTSGSTIKGWRAFTKRDWLAFDRSDYIGAKIILGIALVGSVLFGIFGPILNAVNNAPLPVTYTSKVTSGVELPRGAALDGPATVQVLLKDATAGEPFTRRNMLRINVIALIVGLGGMLVQLAGGIADNAIQTTGRLTSTGTFTFSFTLLPLAVMLVIALVGETFRRGVVLRDDVDGLV